MSTPQQFDLLADTPRSRTVDPATSHIAADEIKSTGLLGEQQRAVRAFVEKYPGRTTAELAHLMAGQKGGSWQDYRPMFGRRMKELIPVYITEGEQRKCTITGRPHSKRTCLTYYPATGLSVRSPYRRAKS